MTSLSLTALWIARHDTPETLERLAQQLNALIAIAQRSRAMMVELKYDTFVAEIDAALAKFPPPEPPGNKQCPTCDAWSCSCAKEVRDERLG